MLGFIKFFLRPFKPLIYPVYLKYYLDRRRFRNFSEADLIELFFRNRRNGVMVDVGAHYGESFAFYADKGWSIHAFEPDQVNRKKITYVPKNVALNSEAVSDKDGLVLDFFQSEESSGISGLVRFHDTHTTTYQVTTITLTTYLQRHQPSRLDFLKIDTEGNDLLVLKGFPFDKFKPDVILCEFEDEKTRHLNYKYSDMGNFLLERGYKVYLSEWCPIVRYGVEHKWRSINQYTPKLKLEDELGWGNFIAVNPDAQLKFEKVLNRYLKFVEK